MATFGNFWQLLAIFGNFWELLATYSTLWQLLATFGKWQIMEEEEMIYSAEKKCYPSPPAITSAEDL